MSTHIIEERKEHREQQARVTVPDLEPEAVEMLIMRINALKRQRNAVILAHNYQVPEIFDRVADVTGDSLELARRAADSHADLIVVCGVHFMAETAKLLNPDRTVLIPDPEAGCSLADSITAGDVRQLRRRYPGLPVVTYVNTPAEVKAESDICCTSGNAVAVVESLGVDRVILIPDRHLAEWVAGETSVEIVRWRGSCEVHEQFDPGQIRAYRQRRPDGVVIAHPECPRAVLDEADVVGSTAGMIRYLEEHHPAEVALITEASMTDNLRSRFPRTAFETVEPVCPYMKRITLTKIVQALEKTQFRVEIPAEIAARARRSVERMLEVGRGGSK